MDDPRERLIVPLPTVSVEVASKLTARLINRVGHFWVNPKLVFAIQSALAEGDQRTAALLVRLSEHSLLDTYALSEQEGKLLELTETFVHTVNSFSPSFLSVNLDVEHDADNQAVDVWQDAQFVMPLGTAAELSEKEILRRMGNLPRKADGLLLLPRELQVFAERGNTFHFSGLRIARRVALTPYDGGWILPGRAHQYGAAYLIIGEDISLSSDDERDVARWVSEISRVATEVLSAIGTLEDS